MRTRLQIAALIAANSLAADLPVPQAGSVTLPIDEYNHLLELASEPVRKPEPPPVPYALKSATLNFEVSGDSVNGTIVLEGETFAPGSSKVPLVSGMVILDAQQRGVDLPVVRENGVLTTLLPGPGEFAITLKTAMPLAIETGRASLTFPAPAAGVVRLTLCVPGEHTAVNLAPGLITSTVSREGRTAVEATLVPGQPAVIWWASRLSPALPPAAPKPVRFLSDVKSLVSVNDSEITIAALADITVVQGDPPQFVIQPPEGYEVTSATGPSLIATDVQKGALTLRVSDPNSRRQEFLITLSKPITAGKADASLITFPNAQRETGELLIESEGAMELNTEVRGGLRRMDLKEASPYLQSLAHASLHGSYRYQKRGAETPALSLEWTRFPDSSVLSAIAQHAVVTTLVSSEGRSLTEVKLTLKNQSQPFLKIGLPAGATILSAEVAGEKVKPVEALDGHRIPLLRPGFRPKDEYTVSFVFLHAGSPFARKGGAELRLPGLAIPIGLLEWEVFLPTRLKVADFGGDVLSSRLYPFTAEDGQIAGVVTDASGAVIPHATVTIVHSATGMTRTVAADALGQWMASDVPSGPVRVTISSPGFQSVVQNLDHDASRGARLDVSLSVGGASETVNVTANAQMLPLQNQQTQKQMRQNAAEPVDVTPSANVAELQRRVAGVLPIAVNVPHTGASYRFVRPLVVDEETRLTFTYRAR
jgi:hypothetical protein